VSAPRFAPPFLAGSLTLALAACSSGAGQDLSAISPGRSRVELSASTLVADGAEFATIRVVVRDGAGRPVEGVDVEVSSSDDEDQIEPPGGPTDLGGSATATIRSIRAGEKRLTVVADDGTRSVQLADHPLVEFLANENSISGSASTLSVELPDGADAVVADGSAGAGLVVVVRDANGNPVPGQPVGFTVSGSDNGVEPEVAVSDARGVARALLTSTTAEDKLVYSWIRPGPAGVQVDGSASIRFVGDPDHVDPDASTVTVDPAGPVVADGVSAVEVTVTVVDVHGNPVHAQPVAVVSSDPDDLLPAPPPTNSDGRTSLRFATLRAGTRVLAVTVDPSGNAVLLSAAPELAFIGDASRISPALSTVEADPEEGVVADGVTTAAIRVTVRDVNENPVPGVEALVLSSDPEDVLVQPAGPTGDDGVALATLATLHAAEKTVQAVLDPDGDPLLLPDTATVRFVGDPANVSPSLSSVAADPMSGLVADGIERSDIVVRIVDVHGNAVGGLPVTIGSDGNDNTIHQPSGVTDPAGMAFASITTTRAEAKTLSVFAGGQGAFVVLDAHPQVQFVPIPMVGPDLSTVTVDPSDGVVADGLDAATITVQLADSLGAPLPDTEVVIEVTGSANTLAAAVGTTDAAGVYATTLTSTRAETKLITVVADPSGDNVVLSDMPTVRFVGDASNPSPTLSSLTVSPDADVVADGVDAATLTATILDAHGNAIEGVVVGFSSDGSADALTPPTATTDAAGVASAALTSTRAETKTLGALVDPAGLAVALADAPQVVFVADASSPSASLSGVELDRTTGIVADGVDAVQVSVDAFDVNGNAIAGLDVALEVEGTDDTVLPALAATDAAGRAAFSLTSTHAEVKVVRAVLDPAGSAVVCDDAPTAEFIGDASDVSATLSSLTIDVATAVADGADVATLTATVRDGNGNAVPDVEVAFQASGADNLLSPATATTDAAGAAVALLSSTRAETKTAGAVVDPAGSAVALADAPAVEFLADASNLSASLSSVAVDAPAVVADGVEAATVTVTVLDANANPVPGVELAVTASGTDNDLSDPPPTDDQGQSVLTLRSTRAEAKGIGVTADPAGAAVVLDDQPTVEFLADAANVSDALSSAVVTPAASVPADGVTTAALDVTVLDGNGNPVPDLAVSFVSDGASDFLVQPPSTDALGTTRGTVASLEAGTRTLTVTVQSAAGPVVLLQRPTVAFDEAPVVWYVRAGGSDASSGVRSDEAFATLLHAVTRVSAGDTVRVGAGTYDGNVLLTASGTAADPIRLVADLDGSFTGDAGEVVIDAGFGPYAVRLQGADFVELEGFTLTGAAFGGAGLHATLGSDSLRLRGAVVHGNHFGVRIDGCADARIESCGISANDDRNVLLEDAPGAVVLDNRIYAGGNVGLQVTGASSTGVLVASNTFYANASDQCRVEAPLVTVRDNVVAAGGGGGIVRLASGSVTSRFNDAWGNAGGDWVGTAAGTGDLSADPLLVDPAGDDDVLGGAGASDDRLLVDAASPTLDAGSGPATSVALSDGTTLAERTTRADLAIDAGRLDLGAHVDPLALPLVAGDLSGDGVPDLALAFPAAEGEPPAVRVWFGRAPLPQDAPVGVDPRRAPDLVVLGPRGDADFGAALAVGDATGDGRSDLAIGSPDHARGAGAVYLLRGPLAPGRLRAEEAALIVVGPGAGAGLGSALALLPLGAGGRPVLVAGAPGTPWAGIDGAVWLLDGGAALPRREPLAAPPGLGSFGAAFAAADLDGDGASELVVAAPDTGPAAVGALCGFRRDPLAGTWTLAASRLGATADERLGAGLVADPDTGVAVLGGGAVLRLAPDLTTIRERLVVPGALPRALAAGDADGDGRPELAVAWVAEGAPDGPATLRLHATAAEPGATGPASGEGLLAALALGWLDLDGDGRSELAAATAAGVLAVARPDRDALPRLEPGRPPRALAGD